MSTWRVNVGNREGREDWFSVTKTLQIAGVEAEKSCVWYVSRCIHDSWLQQYGTEPERRLMKKTCGEQAHVFEIYPPDWQSRIVDVANSVNAMVQGPWEEGSEEWPLAGGGQEAPNANRARSSDGVGWLALGRGLGGSVRAKLLRLLRSRRKTGG